MMSETLTLKKQAVASHDYARSGGRKWVTAFPSHAISVPSDNFFNRLFRSLATPRVYGRDAPNFGSKLGRVVPEVGVLIGPDIYVAGENGVVATADGSILADHSWWRGHFDGMAIPAEPMRVEKIPGTTLVLSTDWGSHSYGHFIQDLMPRINILNKVGVDLNAFDNIFCIYPTDFCRSLLERCGVDPKKIIRLRNGVALKPDNATVPTFPGLRRGMETWAMDFFRNHFPAPEMATRRVYVKRETRKPINEGDLLAILAKHGFEVYSPELDQPNQVKIFSECSIVIGASGSSLANLVFCGKGTKVIELLPSDHVFPYYYSISRAGNLSYRCLVGQSSGERENSTIGPSPFDFLVNADDFALAVSDAL